MTTSTTPCSCAALRALLDLSQAAENLLAFVRSKYPDDFKEGGRGYICPFHIALSEAVKKVKETKL